MMLEKLNDQTRAFVLKMVGQSRIVFERDRAIVPVSFLIAADGGISVLGMSFHNEAEKDGSFAVLAGMVETLGPEVVVFISEAWMGAGQRTTKPKPGDHPGDMEVVQFSVLLRSGIAYFGHARVERIETLEQGTATFGEPEWHETDICGGRIGDIAKALARKG